MFGIKTITIILGSVITLIIIISGMWHIAYDWQSRIPDQQTIETLNSDVEIHWNTHNTAEINAQSLTDAVLGLGYVQGQLNGWTVALWRQAALGQLTDWYGPEMIDADRMVRQLGFGEISKQVYNQLDTQETQLLNAYGHGIQLAWEDADQMREFFLQKIQPSPWESWHSLAIERLIAWMSSPKGSLCDLGNSICTGMVQLRSVLLLHDFESSSAWVVSSSQGPLFYQRHVLGNSISQSFQEVTLTVEDHLELKGASILGTPFFPAAQTSRQAWSVLLNSPKIIRESTTDSTQTVRLSFPHREEMVRFLRTDSTFSAPESNYELYWTGLSTQVDSISWFSLIRNHRPSFQLWRGDGILVPSDTVSTTLGEPEFGAIPRQVPLLIPDESWTILGSPDYIYPINRGGIVISNDSLAKHTASYLDSANPDISSPLSWITDARSDIAFNTLSQMLDSLYLPENPPPMIESAVSYLRNWNHQFEEQSIGATIYNEWVSSIETTLVAGLYDAVDNLTEQFGPNESEWGWERVYTDTSYFTFRGSQETQAYAPLITPIIGHESTMIWGGSRAAAAPVIWESWMWIGGNNSYNIRRRDLNLYQPLARYISDEVGKSVFSLPTSPIKITRLVSTNNE
ncbi:MAG: penicillin acylase family protein [Bacteroidetes bacterium]|nr:penicillin acylase family protein [Bacteroidota bacterium]MCY4233025.1 penicillin acylase family protein [Bacteroidota bacterium]